MKTFVKEAVTGFPGYFSNDHANIKDRIKYLERYAVSYLQKSGKMATNTNVDKKKKKHKQPETSPPPPPKVIQTKRPKPKPLYRGKKTDTAPPPPSSPSPPPPPASPSPPPTPTPAATDTPAETITTDTSDKSDALTQFLAACLPSMQHLTATFHAAGVSERHHLEGIAKWNEEIKHTFIKNSLAHNPMEVQAIASGFAVSFAAWMLRSRANAVGRLC
ncbi:hypothetical protein C8R45DRAFT_951214 [Mycena sanguinolenta]|nr:hypothetical protein C8R45DRAFT_951214 [Mycena sanguinolenta]